MKIIYIIICISVVIEIIIFFSVQNSKHIKWVLTKKKLSELFNEKKFLNFKKKNFNFKLGWDKKSNFKNYDYLNGKKIFYSIDKKGYRSSKFSKKSNKVISYGDSYTFCRQVNNEHTWQEFISKQNNVFVSNFGVGNYGLDQAYLKYLNKSKKPNGKIIIFGIVPETICRIQSSWKHYLEFGNIHGFKPYCRLKNNKIIIKPNPLKKETKIYEIDNVINKTKLFDRFYRDKYLKYLLKFPYLISFIKNYDFNLRIFYKILISRILGKNHKLQDEIFPIVMRSNIKVSHSLYEEEYSKKLLKELIIKINNQISKKNKCYFVIFPQLFDLKLLTREKYQKFYKNLNKKINVIDLTTYFLNKKNYEKLFINDKYGGHLNKKGNKFVANKIQKYLIKS